jgi:cobalt-zinc-cadmium efflux system membrane fusion protein
VLHDIATASRARLGGGLPKSVQLLLLGVLALVAVLALGVAPWVWSRFTAREQVAAAPAAAPGTFRPTEAQWASLKFAPVEETTFRQARVTEGKIALNDDTTTPVFSPYSGRVTKLLAKAGDVVTQGQPLFVVAASEFVQGQNDLIAALQGLNTARAQLRLATTNEKRQHDLYEAKGGSLKDWQQSQADLETARSNERTAEIALTAVRNRLRILGKSDEEIAALEQARQFNAEAVVTAPIGGTVTQRQVGLGQFINSAAAGASSPQFSIGNLNTVWLVANVREVDAPVMRLGAPVEVHVLAYPGKVFDAKITFVAPSVDPNTHRLPVRAEVANPDGALKPEMFANFTIITGDDVAAPAVPQDAVVYEGESARVWVAHADKSLALREIRVGRVSNGRVEVLSGLVPGDTVVSAGSLFIDRAARGD